MKITIAITGASGSIYAQRLILRLVDLSQVSSIVLVLTDTAKQVVTYELHAGEIDEWLSYDKITLANNNTFFHAIASGSNTSDVMVIVPCSMGTVGRITSGVSQDLISRAADVMLKEEKKLIVCPRETPLSLIHIRNILTLKEAGATIIPLSPSFYSNPKTIYELVDTVVERIEAQLGIENVRYEFKTS